MNRFCLKHCAGVLLLLLGTACTPAEQPHHPALFAPVIRNGILSTGDNTQLPVRSWLPEGRPKALVVALHGFNDYSNAFEGPGQYLRQQGIAIFAYDQRGFGATQSHGIWAGERNLISDVRQMVRALRHTYPGIPLYLLGESMGGAVVITAVSSKDFPSVEGIVLSAPAVWGSDTMNALYRMTLWTLAHTAPTEKLTGRGLNIQASDNIEMLRALGRDPLVIKETRIDAIYGIVQLMDSAFRKVHQVKTPMLFLYGANDQVIPKKPVQRVIDNMEGPFKVAYYPEGYHMLLRDLKAELVLRDIVQWILHPNDPLPSGYDKEWQKVMQ